MEQPTCSYAQFCPRVHEDSILGSLPEKVKNVLVWRILHNFVQFMGAQLPWKVVQMAHVLLHGRYRNKYFEEAVDISLVSTDIAINIGASPKDITDVVCYLSTSLQALGHPLVTALVVEEIGNIFIRSDASDCYIVSLKETAFAFENAGMYDRAYETYFKMLSAVMKQQGTGALDVNEEVARGVIVCFIDMLCKWCSRQSSQERQNLLVAFASLLAAADYSPVVRHTALVSPENLGGIKKKYRKKKSAANILSRSVASSDVQSFQNVILRCKDAQSNGKLRVFDGMGTKPARNDSPIDAESIQKAAQESLRTLGEGTMLFVYCGNPDCGTRASRADMKLCPCKHTYYCQKNCQVKDWKEHKKTCTHYASRS